MDEAKQSVLSQIAAFRTPMKYDMLALFNTFGSDEAYDAILEELIDRGLVFFDPTQGSYDLHPVVRQYAYDRLTAKKAVHSRLLDYFAAVPPQDSQKIQGLEDLAPVIELYHHTVGAGRFKEAFRLYEDRLDKLLYDRLGCYLPCISLLRALFPDDNEEALPRVRSGKSDPYGQGDQSWTFKRLADCYARSGQPRQAAFCYMRSIQISANLSGEQGIHRSAAYNLATSQFALGELYEAGRTLKRHRDDFAKSPEAEDQTVLLLLWFQLIRGNRNGAQKGCSALMRTFIQEYRREPGGKFDWTLYGLCFLHLGDYDTASTSARKALALGEACHLERDIVRGKWLLATAMLASLSQQVKGTSRDDVMGLVATHLADALSRCRQMNLIEYEPDNPTFVGSLVTSEL